MSTIELATPLKSLIGQNQRNNYASTSQNVKNTEGKNTAANSVITKRVGFWSRQRQSNESDGNKPSFETLVKYLGHTMSLSTLFAVCIIGFIILAIEEIHNSNEYSSQCSIQPNIPTFLSILGIISLVAHINLFILAIITLIERRQLFKIFCIVILIFVWIIVGSVWTLNIYNRLNYDDTLKSSNYCHKTLYQFTFVCIFLNYIILLATILIGQHVDEAVKILKDDGLEPRVFHHMGVIRSENPKMVQLQVDPETKEVQSVA
ncbi:hypothetical protein I4U23_019932 [Adineta vaga]|nr:hypothetical protein I4U23_019932 [Adineta vaga]